MHDNEIIDPSRPMTAPEKRMLLRLLSADFQGNATLRSQFEHVRVGAKCSCGCPSIIFDVDKSKAEKASVSNRIPIEAEAADSDGMKIHYLLHVVEGFLFELEIYREDSEKILTLPNAEALQIVFGPLGGQPHRN